MSNPEYQAQKVHSMSVVIDCLGSEIARKNAEIEELKAALDRKIEDNVIFIKENSSLNDTLRKVQKERDECKASSEEWHRTSAVHYDALQNALEENKRLVAEVENMQDKFRELVNKIPKEEAN
jgi:regulator of replication initiation timing